MSGECYLNISLLTGFYFPFPNYILSLSLSLSISFFLKILGLIKILSLFSNSVEMRHNVTTRGYIFRKMIDNALAALTAPHLSFPSLAPNLAKEPSGFLPAAPSGWLPLYRMVTFRPDISYGTVKRKAERQNTIIRWIGVTGLGVGICLGLAGIRVLIGSRRHLIESALS